MKGKMTKSKRISLIVTFAAVAAILDSIPGFAPIQSVWYSWIFLVAPLFGFILGPVDGFLSILIGVLVGHSIYFRGIHEFLFTIGAPVGAMIAGMLFRKKRSIPIIFFTVLLASYFLTPISWQLPLWGMWDVYLAFIVLLIVTIIRFNKSRLLISTFVGLEADILFRIFLFNPSSDISYILWVNARSDEGYLGSRSSHNTNTGWHSDSLYNDHLSTNPKSS